MKVIFHFNKVLLNHKQKILLLKVVLKELLNMAKGYYHLKMDVLKI